MVLFADVDVSLLKELHEYGSVQNLKDRRTDLYEVAMKRAAPPKKPHMIMTPNT